MTAVDDRPQRALPGMDGAVHYDLPTVDQVVDDDGHNVTLDVAEHVDLVTLFQAIAGDHALRHAIRILMHNRANTDLQRGAVRDLLAVKDIRNALTLTFGPSQAEDLAEQLGRAAESPSRCAFCPAVAVAREGDHDVCEAHVQPDEYDEFERQRDH